MNKLKCGQLIEDFVVLLINIYQCFFSMLFGCHCRFNPSCSNYAIIAIRKRGVFIGVFLSIKRILKCNPFCWAGYDFLHNCENENRDV